MKHSVTAGDSGQQTQGMSASDMSAGAIVTLTTNKVVASQFKPLTYADASSLSGFAWSDKEPLPSECRPSPPDRRTVPISTSHTLTIHSQRPLGENSRNKASAPLALESRAFSEQRRNGPVRREPLRWERHSFQSEHNRNKPNSFTTHWMAGWVSVGASTAGLASAVKI